MIDVLTFPQFLLPSHDSQMMILQVFSKLAQDPQTIVDIFLNYDCDANPIPIFQHLVAVLEKITQVLRIQIHTSHAI